MSGLSKRYIAALGGLAAVGVFLALVSFGVPPFNNLAIFVFSQVAAAFTLLLFGVIGGAFVGMLMAHRMLGNRQFTPYERTVLESLADIRERLNVLERRLDDPRLRPPMP